MHTLQLDVSIVLLEVEVEGLVEIDVWPLDSEETFSSHHELVHVEVLRKYLHFYDYNYYI